MLDQLELDPLLTQGTTPRLDIFAGYSWGLPTGVVDDYLTGVTISPKWYERASSEARLRQPLGERYASGRPLASWERQEDIDPDEADAPLQVMLDNGAYPAWKRGHTLTLDDQLSALHRGLELFEHADWIIAPDVVAQPRASWRRTVSALPELEPYGLGRLLLPLQNGMDVTRLVDLARDIGGGVFVGGTKDGFKLDALCALQAHDVYVHVGQMASDAELAACARLGAHSIDSTNFLRQQNHNRARRLHYLRSFERYARRRGGALDDQPLYHH